MVAALAVKCGPDRICAEKRRILLGFHTGTSNEVCVRAIV